MQDLDRFSRCQAIGVGQVFFVDVMTAHRHGQQDAEQTRAAKPTENLQCVEINRRVEHALRVQHVERGQQHCHESRLAGAGAHCLHDIVFARVRVG